MLSGRGTTSPRSRHHGSRFHPNNLAKRHQQPHSAPVPYLSLKKSAEIVSAEDHGTEAFSPNILTGESAFSGATLSTPLTPLGMPPRNPRRASRNSTRGRGAEEAKGGCFPAEGFYRHQQQPQQQSVNAHYQQQTTLQTENFEQQSQQQRLYGGYLHSYSGPQIHHHQPHQQHITGHQPQHPFVNPRQSQQHMHHQWEQQQLHHQGLMQQHRQQVVDLQESKDIADSQERWNFKDTTDAAAVLSEKDIEQSNNESSETDTVRLSDFSDHGNGGSKATSSPSLSASEESLPSPASVASMTFSTSSSDGSFISCTTGLEDSINIGLQDHCPSPLSIATASVLLDSEAGLANACITSLATPETAIDEVVTNPLIPLFDDVPDHVLCHQEKKKDEGIIERGNSNFNGPMPDVTVASTDSDSASVGLDKNDSDNPTSDTVAQAAKDSDVNEKRQLELGEVEAAHQSFLRRQEEALEQFRAQSAERTAAGANASSSSSPSLSKKSKGKGPDAGASLSPRVLHRRETLSSSSAPPFMPPPPPPVRVTMQFRTGAKPRKHQAKGENDSNIKTLTEVSASVTGHDGKGRSKISVASDGNDVSALGANSCADGPDLCASATLMHGLDVSNGLRSPSEYVLHISKRLRALRKRLTRIEGTEKSIGEDPEAKKRLNTDQLFALENKKVVVASITELEEIQKGFAVYDFEANLKLREQQAKIVALEAALEQAQVEQAKVEQAKVDQAGQSELVVPEVVVSQEHQPEQQGQQKHQHQPQQYQSVNKEAVNTHQQNDMEEMATLTKVQEGLIELVRFFYVMRELEGSRAYLSKSFAENLKALEEVWERLVAYAQEASMVAEQQNKGDVGTEPGATLGLGELIQFVLSMVSSEDDDKSVSESVGITFRQVRQHLDALTGHPGDIDLQDPTFHATLA